MKAEGIPDHDGEVPNVLVESALIPRDPSVKPSATAVQENTFTPVFEELFEYAVDLEELLKKKLHLVVWYVDPYYHLTSLGEVIYSLSQLDIEGFDISQTAMLFCKEIMQLHQTKVESCICKSIQIFS
jgi:Ca2+-dependent lipid-binding protein